MTSPLTPEQVMGERDRLRKLINYDYRGECQPTCDRYGHADNCAYSNFYTQWEDALNRAAEAESALAAAEARASAAEPGWKPVSAGLPSHNRVVLVVYHKTNSHQVGRRHTVVPAKYSGGAWRFVEARYAPAARSDRVTHWMDIPEPPAYAARAAQMAPVDTGRIGKKE